MIDLERDVDDCLRELEILNDALQDAPDRPTGSRRWQILQVRATVLMTETLLAIADEQVGRELKKDARP